MKRIEDKNLLTEIEKFIKSGESVFMNKQFHALCKIHNPFGYVENGKIVETEYSNPHLIIELSWEEFVDKFGLTLKIDSETSISQIQKAYADKHGDQDYGNFYWASGSLGKKQVDKIMDLINEIFDIESFYCYYSLITNFHFDNPEDEVFLTDFEHLKLLINKKKGFSPTMWWDKNLDWMVYTDYDLTSSYVFSEKQLIDRIVGDSQIESFALMVSDFEADFDKNILK
jgi:hypothetical protein